jgi:hypothetical protein
MESLTDTPPSTPYTIPKENLKTYMDLIDRSKSNLRPPIEEINVEKIDVEKIAVEAKIQEFLDGIDDSIEFLKSVL